MSEDFKIISDICEKDLSHIQELSSATREFTIESCFDCLYQKTGNIELSKEILKQFGEIKVDNNDIIYTGDPTKLNILSQLIRTGVAILPIIEPEELPKYQKDFDETLLSFQEYKKNKNKVYVLGGFAALGNPSSFHNLLVRKLRKKSRKKVKILLGRYRDRFYNDEVRKSLNFEMLLDRMMYRMKNQKPVAEAWHRDVMIPESIEDNDEIFGGWINLDSQNQYFSCISGSHLGVLPKQIKPGFDTLAKNYEEYLKKNGIKDEKKIKELVKKKIADIGKQKTIFAIPPGCLIIFPQYILHEVVSTTAKYNMKRLFTGWRLTSSNISLYDTLNKVKGTTKNTYKTLDDILDYQGVPPLPGSMIPPMYSANHGSSFLGIPTFTIAKKGFDYKKWAIKLGNKFTLLYGTEMMFKLNDKLKNESNIKKSKKIIYDMLIEFKNTGVEFVIDKNKFFDTEDFIVNLNTFKTIPNDQTTETTLIEWSKKNMKEITIVEKTNNRGYKYNVVSRWLDSLYNYKLPLYPKYTYKEKTLYRPEKF